MNQNHYPKLLDVASNEGSFAGVGQVIAGIKFVSFLTPDMASENDARQGIDYSVLGQPDGMSGVKKLANFHAVINCTTSVAYPDGGPGGPWPPPNRIIKQVIITIENALNRGAKYVDSSNK